MSNALAIGAVTAVLRDLLANRFNDPIISANLGGTPTITALPPDIVVSSPTNGDGDGLNLFMYQVSPNTGWRNVDYPARDSEGERIRYPPLALDLYYLLSAYSQETFHAEMLLGYGMQLLHEVGVLPRNLVQTRLGDLEPPEDVLATSELAQQIEMIKIVPKSLSTEEISKLWAAFQTNYRPTAAYQASVVLIETDRPPRSALPVRERRVFVIPFQRPLIEAIQPQIIGPGETLTIQGHNLSTSDIDNLRIRFGSEPLVAPNPEEVSNTQISVTPSASLAAGVNPVQVVHFINYEPAPDNDPDLREGFESNLVAFILTPRITTAFPITVAQGETLTLDVEPPVGQQQRVALLLGDQAIAGESRSIAEPPTPTANLDFLIPTDFPIGDYLARLQVDGVSSPLEVDEDETSPTFNQYIGPTITVT